MATKVDIKQLLEAGAHFGHQTSRWHPKMAQYIHSKRGGSHIIDLTKTVDKLETALNVLRSPGKWALGIFPEGTRSKTGQLSPLKKGFGSLAAKTNVPILPIGIFRPSKNSFVLTVGKPITDVSDAEHLHELVKNQLEILVDLGRQQSQQKKP